MMPKACQESRMNYLPSICFSSVFVNSSCSVNSLFISTCSKIILISWLCIPARPCTSITWNLTPQEEVVIMAERLILDFNFKRNPVMHKICTWCWCSFLHPVRPFQWYLTCCLDTISACQTGNSCVEMEEKSVHFLLQCKLWTSISDLFEFGSVYQARFLYCVLLYLHSET